MKHKKFDSDILRDIKNLYVYDNWHAIIAISKDYLLIFFSIWLSEISYYFLPLSILIIGSRQRALATILHEASHGALTLNKKLGKILGTYFSGYLIFQSWTSYYASHVKNHHPKLGSSSDPDYQFYKDTGIFNKHSKFHFFWKFFISYILFLRVFSSFKYLLKNRLLAIPNKNELIAIWITQLIFFVVGSLAVGYKFYFLYWLLPYLTTFQVITWFIELSEHYPMVQTASINIEASRNRFSHWTEHFFMSIHGENYHLIHHLFLAIPFWNLSKAHDILMRDSEYRAVNQSFGGIFISANHNPSMWKQLWRNHATF